jgi:acetate kinase
VTDHPAVVLAINPGSSSLKAVLRDPDPALVVGIERLGTDQARWTATATGQAPASQPFVGDLPAAITQLAGLLMCRDVHPDAVAHRVVHGGPSFDRSTVITDAVREALAGLLSWAPLHLPGDLASIDAARVAWPDALHVACFDTAFHHTLPDEARRLPLPAQADRLGLRRYGFHGLSVQSIVDAVPDLGDATIAHLGSGCSVTAVSAGRSVHSSMSLTPTSGVMSATRSGDLDPEIPLLLLEAPDATTDTIRTLLDQHCGLAGIAHGLHDVRDLLAARDHDPSADLALRVFTRGVAMAIAAAATALPRWDTLVFTGGIGEHAPAVYGEICHRLTSLRSPLWASGISTTTTGAVAGVRELTATGVAVLIVPADEAAVMDREARALLTTATG